MMVSFALLNAFLVGSALTIPCSGQSLTSSKLRSNNVAMSDSASLNSFSMPSYDVSTRNLEAAYGPWSPIGEDLFGLPPLDANTLVGFGDSIAISQSDDGENVFMAIGAPLSDYSDGTNTSDVFHNPGGGLVRLFQLSKNPSPSWELIWTFAGSPGETIGYGFDLVNLSPTVNRIAIRRSDKVILRDVDTEGNASIIGVDPLTASGKLVKLNAEGTIMAVASETLNSQRGRVQVFRSSDLVTFLAWELDVVFDGDEIGDRLGYSLAIDSAGSRIAFGMPYNNGSTGMVRVYEYNGSEWVQVAADIIGKSLGDLFGWSLDMSADGKTIVVGATGSYTDGGIATDARGSILVYEELDGVWQQVGVDLEGEATKEQIGRAVTMDSTGTRIAASSFKYNGHKGRVKVFNYNNETLSGWDMVTEVNGEATHERMGRGLSSLAMSNDGKILAIGSPLEEVGTNKTGKVHIIEEQDPTSSPSASPSSIPYVAPSSMPSGLPSVSLSNEPSSAPSKTPSQTPSVTSTASPSDMPSEGPSSLPSMTPTTKASVTPSSVSSDIPSFAPSLYPSTMPSAFPSISPSRTPSFQPTVTQSPTEESGGPSDSTGWDIFKLQNATIAFDDESKTEEIKMYFNVSDRARQITVFESDCRTLVSSAVIGATGDFVIRSEAHGDLTVSLDIKEETIADSPIWSWDEAESNLANIDICVRVELLVQKLDDSTIGVNFLHAELSVTLDMSIGFDSATIVAEEESFGVDDRSVSADFLLESCQCNDAWECILEPIAQSEFLNICLLTNSSGTRFESLDSFQLKQPIVGGTLLDKKVQTGEAMSELTTVVMNGNRLKITTQPANFFFLNDNANVIAEGFAVIEFGATGVRRLLRASMPQIQGRALEGETGSGSFTQEVTIRSGDPSSGAFAVMSSSASIILATILAAILV